MANNSAPPTLEQPNDFALEGDNKQIRFSTGGFVGRPSFSYKDVEHSLDFSGDDIDIAERRFGNLITVTIEHLPDVHFVDLTLLLPTIYLPEGAREHPIKTKAIVTTILASFTSPENPFTGQVQTYEILDLKGTARLLM